MRKRIASELDAVRRSLKPGTWERRLADADAQSTVIEAVEQAKQQGEPYGAAIARLAPGWGKSTYRKRRRKYRRDGVKGLMNLHLGGATRSLSPEVRQAICLLRRANRQMTAGRIAEVVKEQFGVALDLSSINKVLKAEGLERQRGPVSRKEPVTEELQFAGAAFFQIADQELGCSAGLAEQIVAQARQAPEPEPIAELRDEAAGREEQGRFGPGYNQARAKGDAKLGPAFRSVAEQREEVDLRKRKLVKESLETVQRKVQAAIALPLLTEAGRTTQLDDYRGGHGIAEFCGVRYTGDTIDRFLRDAKYLDLATPLSEHFARFWLAHEPRGTDNTPPAGVGVYLDGVTKPVWTRFFTRAGKVSSTGRVMPCLEQIFIHTGTGTPLFWWPFSGTVNLAAQTLPLIKKLEEIVGEGWCAQRLFVIDSGGSAVWVFKEFDDAKNGGKKKRLFITMMRDNQVSDLSKVTELTPWQPYRNGDEIAEGWALLNDSHDDKAPPYRIRVVVIRRRRKGTLTILGTNAPAEKHGTEFIANTYFERWPRQEGRFRTFNQGTNFKAVIGYGKRLVQNVTVISKLDELQNRRKNLTTSIEKQQEKVRSVRDKLRQARLRVNAAKARRARQDGLVDEVVAARKIDRDLLQGRIEVTQAERERLAMAEGEVRKTEKVAAAEEAKLGKLERTLPEVTKEIATLEERREIYQSDTELDSLMTCFKLFFVLICEFVLREYFDGLRLSLHGFMRQVLSLPGTRTLEGKVEHIRIKASPNREIMQAVAAACERVNARGVVRNGRTVRITVQWDGGAHRRGANGSC